MTFHPMLRTHRRLGAALVLAATAALGCTGEITVQQPGDDPGSPETPGETCTPAPQPSQPDPQPVAVSAVKSAAFIADTLQLEADLDGFPNYLVLTIDDAGLVRFAAQHPDLTGPANLVQSAPGVHVRVRADAYGTPRVDVLDTSEPRAPGLISFDERPGSLTGQPVFSTVDDRVFFCITPPGADAGEVTALGLADPSDPGPAQTNESFLCYWHSEHEYSVAGSTWLLWDHPTGYEMQSVYVYTVGPDGPKKVVDYGYNQTGVHMYGNVLYAATSAERAVLDPEHKSLFMLANPAGNPYSTDDPPFTWTSLTVGKERQLVGVADSTVYLLTDEGLRAYDISDITAPVLLPYKGQIEHYEGALRTIATSDRYLAVVDEKGTLFLVPRDSFDSVGPLVVHAMGYALPEQDCSN
jgi:hypothetical protein